MEVVSCLGNNYCTFKIKETILFRSDGSDTDMVGCFRRRSDLFDMADEYVCLDHNNESCWCNVSAYPQQW